MKICLISNLYEPYSRGGAESVVKNIFTGLQNRGEDVILITTQPFNGLRSLLPETKGAKLPIGSLAPKIRIYRFYPLNLFFYVNDYKHNALTRFFWHIFDVFNPHSYFVVKNILQREKPDVVYTHNLKGIGYLIPRAIRKLQIKHIHTLHDIQLASPSGLMIKGQERNWQQTGFLTKFYSKICRYLFDSPEIIISPSEWLMKYYVDKNFFKKSKRVVLRNPVNIIKTLKHKNIKTILDNETKRNSIPNWELNFLFAGQIEEHKGILFLIETWMLNLQIGGSTSTRLEIIGDGLALEKAKAIANLERSIIFHGKLNHEEVSNKINSADFVIVPSLCYENSPQVVAEALSAGTPVIAANIGGCAELIEEGVNGYKFIAGDKEDLINKIKLAVENVEKFDSQKIRQTVAGLELDNYIKRLMDL